MLSALLDFLFPPHCPACDAYVPGRGDWCEGCLAAAIAPVRLAVTEAFEAWALGAYEEPLSRMVKDLKYHGKRSVLPAIATFLRAVPVCAKGPFDFATCVPLAPKRQKARGFNQAEEIFRPWLKEQGIPLRQVIRRTRETRPMYGLTKKERQENMKGAIALAEGASVEGARVLLLDDIFTTGATTEAALFALKKGGAASVSILCLASNAGR